MKIWTLKNSSNQLHWHCVGMVWSHLIDNGLANKQAAHQRSSQFDLLNYDFFWSCWILVCMNNLFKHWGKIGLCFQLWSAEKHKTYMWYYMWIYHKLNYLYIVYTDWTSKYFYCADRSVEANRPTSPIRTQSMYRPTPQRKPPPKPSTANIYKVSHSLQYLCYCIYQIARQMCINIHCMLMCTHSTVCVFVLVSVTAHLICFLL